MSETLSSNPQGIPGPGARQFAELFHATYERLAPEYGYTTRTDTRRFDHGSENGKLMIAVCDYLLTWLDEGAPAEIERLRSALRQYGAHTDRCPVQTGIGACDCGWGKIDEQLSGLRPADETSASLPGNK